MHVETVWLVLGNMVMANPVLVDLVKPVVTGVTVSAVFVQQL